MFEFDVDISHGETPINGCLSESLRQFQGRTAEKFNVLRRRKRGS